MKETKHTYTDALHTRFRTPVELPEAPHAITHSRYILLMGSCFAEHIGARLADAKFRVEANPFGILYNPLSIATAVGKLLTDDNGYTEADLFLHDGLWHSPMHHGSFSKPDREEALHGINRRLHEARTVLPETEWLMLTWGTAYVYEDVATHRVVANCHKLPEKQFVRRRMTVEEIVVLYDTLIRRLTDRLPQLKVLLTISPVRHVRDGMHSNQLSKSTLLLAADMLQERFPQTVCYFPSYEIVTDELRDYRFYADDMVHPSTLAVNYVWECFARMFFGEETRQIIARTEEIRKALEHKPFHPESEAYQRFLEQLVLKIEQLNGKYPYLDLQNERKLCHTRLKP